MAACLPGLRCLPLFRQSQSSKSACVARESRDRDAQGTGMVEPRRRWLLLPQSALKLTSYSLSFRPFFRAVLASPAPPPLGISFCMRISLHQPFSIRPHPVRGSVDEYPESETREIADERGEFFFSAISIAANRFLRVLFFFLFFFSAKNLSESRHWAACCKWGMVSRWK